MCGRCNLTEQEVWRIITKQERREQYEYQPLDLVADITRSRTFKWFEYVMRMDPTWIDKIILLKQASR
jgi:hypothetical protein